MQAHNAISFLHSLPLCQVTLEESDQENLAELEECDESDSRADAGSSTATGATAASGGGGPKPSGSQNQAQHGGMWRRVVGIYRKLTEKAHSFFLLR